MKFFYFRDLSDRLSVIVGLSSRQVAGLAVFAAVLVVGGVAGSRLASPPNAELVAQSSPAITSKPSWRLGFEATSGKSAAAFEVNSHTAEEQLRKVYALLNQGDRQSAMAQALRLTREYPNFQLGHLLYADLLSVGLPEPLYPTDVVGGNKDETSARLEELLLESKLRLPDATAQSRKGLVPLNLMALSNAQPYAIAVDTSRSRLYWFVNRSTGKDSKDSSRVPQLELMFDTYVSVGNQGVGKKNAGDKRTPLGIYFIGQTLPGKNMPDLYGSGALTLNYPNALDALRGKTGSGIWLHGTPQAQFSRAPLATDGCVVLANPEIERMMRLPGIKGTPVVIADRLEWVPSGQLVQAREGFMKTFDAWAKAKQSLDLNTLRSFYSPRFQRDGKSLEQWWPQMSERPRKSRAMASPEIQSLLSWHDDDETMVVTLADPGKSHLKEVPRLRQYWLKEPDAWKIIFEGPL